MAESLEVLMQKALKLSIMGFNFAKLKQVFDAIDWSAQEQLVEIRPKFVGDEVAQITGIESFHFSGGKKSDHYEIRLYNFPDEEEKNKEIVRHCQELVKKQKQMKKWSHNFYDVSSGKAVTDTKDSTDVPRFVFQLDYRLVVPGMKIISKSGKTFMLHMNGLRDKSMNNNDLVTWLKEETTFTEEVADHLGVETPEKRKRVERTRENTGTCGICCKEQKLSKQGNLVHHGFTKPGFGYIQGDCFGVGFKPYELSAQACKSYIEVLTRMMNDNKAALRRHQNGEILTLSVQTKTYKIIMGHKVYDTKLVNKGTPEFDQAQKIMIAKLQGEIRKLQTHIVFYQERVDNWKLDTLPWDKLQKMSKK
ncbi:hypothetical protein RsoM2USA_71 [Ralstonia phage RsoM2USA]|nr:hypothetical protein RsoM2USA_71 [Ralstonia phage RsoM2USA]